MASCIQLSTYLFGRQRNRADLDFASFFFRKPQGLLSSAIPQVREKSRASENIGKTLNSHTSFFKI